MIFRYAIDTAFLRKVANDAAPIPTSVSTFENVGLKITVLVIVENRVYGF